MENVRTTYKCVKCNIENVLDLYDENGICEKMYKGEPHANNFEVYCKSCNTKHLLTIKLFWKETEEKITLAKWDILSYHKGIEKIQGVGKIKHLSSSAEKVDYHSLNEEADTIMDKDEKVIFSAIWIGLVKLKIPERIRKEIMENIENITEKERKNRGEEY